MKLRIDTEPRIDKLEFSTLKMSYSDTASPRSMVTQSGIEFDHFRQYFPTDDAKLIDWIASARTNDLLVRVFTEEVSMNVLIAVDVSSSMIYGTGEKAKIEFAIELALNVAFGVLNYGDSVGIALFNKDVTSYTPFLNGPGAFGAIREALLKQEAYDGMLDFNKSLAFLIEFFKKTHLLILISDFLGYGASLENNLNAVVDKFDILGMMVNDKSDLEIVNTAPVIDIQDPYSLKTRYINSSAIAEEYIKENKKRVNNLRNLFAILGKQLWTFSTDDDIARKIPHLLAERNYLGGFS